jgi:hypothetical protein
MSLSADIFRRLSVLKLQPEAMSVVLEIIADIQTHSNNRRERDRDRKRNVRGQSAEKERSPHTPLKKNINNIIPRKHELPEGWQPNESDLAYGKKLGLLNGQFEGQLEAMKLWAKANRILKVDWNATLKGFLRREAEKICPANGQAKAVGVKANWRIGADGKWTKELP